MTESVDANILSLIIVLVAIGLLPFLAVLVTSFAKIAIVLLIVRNALGIQQTPPNIVIYGVAIILSVYIAAPVAEQLALGIQAAPRLETLDDWTAALQGAIDQIRGFLAAHVRDEDRDFFQRTAATLWGEAGANVGPNDLAVLAPAFLVSELTRAFEIGFLIYLPFLAIDLIVAAILMSLGMMMVSPIMIAAPFKLFLFIAADGWSRLVQGLVLSYAT